MVLQQTLYIALFAISFSINGEMDELEDSKTSNETTLNNAILCIMTHWNAIWCAIWVDGRKCCIFTIPKHLQRKCRIIFTVFSSHLSYTSNICPSVEIVTTCH